MSTKVRLMACLGVAFAPWLFSISVTAQADETLSLKTVIPIKIGAVTQVLRSFDISWVDATRHTYALAASSLNAAGLGPASDPAIVIVDTTTNAVTKELGANPKTPFSGSCSIPPIEITFPAQMGY